MTLAVGGITLAAASFDKIPALREKRWGPWLFLAVGTIMTIGGLVVIVLFWPGPGGQATDEARIVPDEHGSETSSQVSASGGVSDLSPAPRLNQTVLINGTPRQGHTYVLTASGCPGSELVAQSQVIANSATLRFEAALADDAAPESKVAIIISQEDERVFEDILAPLEPVTIKAPLSKGVYSMKISTLNGAEDDCKNTQFTFLIQNFSLSDG